VLYLLAERMRNAGKFTVADVLAFRLKARPVRVATAINTLLISGIYLVAQLVGAGAVIEALAGISFPIAVLICGVFMVVYVVFGGMLATTWVQIIKAVMLMIAGTIVARKKRKRKICRQSRKRDANSSKKKTFTPHVVSASNAITSQTGQPSSLLEYYLGCRACRA